MKCGNCGHEENFHEDITLRRLGKDDVEMKPCLHVELPMGAICSCKSFQERSTQTDFKSAVIKGIQEYDAEIDDADAEAMAELAWTKFMKGFLK